METVTTGPLPAWFPRALFPFQSRFTEIKGCRVHFVDEGEGPPIVFVHGNPTWSFLYRELIKGLRDRYRCIALDLPGFGLSTAPPGYAFTPEAHAGVLEAFLAGLKLSGAALMGQDWGGPIGLAVATRHPALFRALIIGNTFAWPVHGDRHFERFSNLMGGSLGGFCIRNFNAFVNVMIPAGVKRGTLPKEVMRAYRGPFPTSASREPTHIFPREILASQAFLATLERDLPALAGLPALILWGDRDIAFREKERRRFEALFPQHRTLVLKGAGHFIQEDAPQEIVAAIRAWPALA